MDDQELAAIRAARLQQLRQNASPAQTSSLPQLEGLPTGGGPGASDPDADAKRAAEEQMRRDLLVTVLDPKARERLANIRLVSPTRATQIESLLLRLAQSGQLRGRIGEEQLISLLEQAEDAQSKAGAKKGAIMYQRRKELHDEGDDFELDL